MERLKILVRLPNWLGDIVMATPVIEDLKTQYPKAFISVEAPQAFASLLMGNPHVDEILHLNKKKVLGTYDVGILLTNSFSSAWRFWKGKIKRRIGFANECRSFLLTDSPPFPNEKGLEHLVTTYKRVLAPLNIPVSNTFPKIYVSEKEKADRDALLETFAKTRKVIGIHAGAAFGQAKCWLPDRFRKVAFKLLEDPKNHLLFFGDAASLPLISEITKEMPKRALNLAGKTTLRECIALIDACDVFLTNDSGPMHIAAALKKPLVALFGSTNEVATGPYGHGKVIHKHVSCSPCYLRTCPIDFRCMKSIEVDEVVKELEALLLV